VVPFSEWNNVAMLNVVLLLQKQDIPIRRKQCCPASPEAGYSNQEKIPFMILQSSFLISKPFHIAGNGVYASLTLTGPT
jgi:hypothetical protein